MKKFTNSLTSFRAIAAVIVVLVHESGGQQRKIRSIEEMGNISVAFFFVLSAYLLTRNLLGDILPKNNQAPKNILNMTLVRYFVRRFMRIYPALAATVLLNYCVFYNFGKNTHYDSMDFDRIKESLTFQPVNNHLWTIRVESAFYFIFLPVFGVLASLFLFIDFKYLTNYHRFLKTFYLYIAVITAISLWIQIDFGNFTDLYDNRKILSLQFTIFWYGSLGGILSHYISSYKPSFDTKWKVALWELVSYLLLFRIVFGNKILTAKVFGLTRITWWQSIDGIAPFISLLLLLLEFAETNLSLGRFLSGNWLISLGTYSYSIYLIHYGSMKWLRGLKELDSFDSAILVLATACFFGFLLYKLVEEPSFRLSKYIICYLEKLNVQVQSKSKVEPILLQQYNDQLESDSPENKNAGKDSTREVNKREVRLEVTTINRKDEEKSSLISY